MVEKFETQLKKKQQVFVKIQVYAMLIWYLIILENWYIDIHHNTVFNKLFWMIYECVIT